MWKLFFWGESLVEGSTALGVAWPMVLGFCFIRLRYSTFWVSMSRDLVVQRSEDLRARTSRGLGIYLSGDLEAGDLGSGDSGACVWDLRSLKCFRSLNKIIFTSSTTQETCAEKCHVLVITLSIHAS